MNIEKMIEKINKVFEETSYNDNKILAHANIDTGALFCVNPYMMYHLYDQSILTARINENESGKKSLMRVWSDALKNNTPGEATPGTLYGKKMIRIYNGIWSAYIDKKFTKGFPKNTVYYSDDPQHGVIAAIIEKDKIYRFALIMPIHVHDGREFIPDGATV